MSLSSAVLAVALLGRFVLAQGDVDPPAYPTCEAYGVDFQSDGTYFQNITDTSSFTFVSIYEHCQNDQAYNILVDPSGAEYQCSNTPLQPDDTNQLSTCPILKSQLFSGPWSVLILSNNGEADPVAYERPFNLVVGIPSTIVVTPTITVSVSSTPIVSSTISTTTTTSTTSTFSTTLPSRTVKPTTTVYPPAKTTTRTYTSGTIRTTATVVKPTYITRTITQTCTFSIQPHNDPWLTWVPRSVPPSCSASVVSAVETQATETQTAASAAVTPTKLARRADSVLFRRVPADQAERIAERNARYAEDGIEKRGLDSATVTITDINTAAYPTQTAVITAPPSTVLFTTQVIVTQTLTSTTTIYSGVTTQAEVTVTARTQTRTIWSSTIVTSTVRTVTRSPTITITTKTAAPSITSACSVKGGRMYPW